MIRIMLAGVRANTLRALLTAVAVAIGVSLLAGTLIYGDTAKAAFFADLARSGVGVDVAVQPPGGRPPFWRQGRLPASDLETVRSIPGVGTADGRAITTLALLDHSGRVISNAGSVGAAVSVPAVSRLSMFSVVQGHVPTSTGEAALDRQTATREGVPVGSTVTVLDADSTPQRLSIVGIVDFGTNAYFSGASVVVLPEAVLWALTRTDGYAEIVATAAPGVSPQVLRQRIAATLDRQRVITGDRLRSELAFASAKYVDGFLDTLLGCAIVALVVACIVVYNTFTILVAQRRRQLALLRCCGAGRGQVFALVLGESFVVGLLASVAGLGLSAVVGRVMLVGRNVVGGGVPDHRLVVTGGTVFVTLVAGTLTTVASGLLPAVAASRVAPVAALRSASDPVAADPGRTRMPRLATAGLLVAAGAAACARGFHQGFGGTPEVLAGAMAVFVAIIVVLPLVVAPVLGLLGWLPGRLFGPTARLATSNAQRDPARVAATAIALTTGIALISMFTVVLATARVQGERELLENFPIDFTVDRIDAGAAPAHFDDALVPKLRARTEFAYVASTVVIYANLNGDMQTLSTVDPADLGRTVTPEVLRGTLAGGLPEGAVALRRTWADPAGVDVGDTVHIRPSGTRGWSARVVAVFDDSPTAGEAIVNWDDVSHYLGDSGSDELLIRKADAVSASDARTALDAVLVDEPLAGVTSTAERRADLAASYTKRELQLAGLLGMSVLIAIFGIMDALSLAVLERTRESATLRALGLANRQLRATLLMESVLVAVIGALVGVAFGVAFGSLVASGLIGVYGHGGPTVPWWRIAGYVVLAAVAAALASLLPARRATRASIVAAMIDT
jgi:putative ABC transport system permease protein